MHPTVKEVLVKKETKAQGQCYFSYYQLFYYYIIFIRENAFWWELKLFPSKKEINKVPFSIKENEPFTQNTTLETSVFSLA